jgi:hypothetical protein
MGFKTQFFREAISFFLEIERISTETSIYEGFGGIIYEGPKKFIWKNLL